MTEKAKQGPLFLLPMPLSPEQQKQKKRFLTERLKQHSLEEIAMQELYKIYSWRQLDDTKLKRLYRDYSLIYSPDELKNFLLATYRTIISSDDF